MSAWHEAKGLPSTLSTDRDKCKDFRGQEKGDTGQTRGNKIRQTVGCGIRKLEWGTVRSGER